VTHALDDAAMQARGVHAAATGRGDLALRVLGAVVALLGGAGSALLEAVLTPVRAGGWAVPIAPLLAAVLGVPLVSYAVAATGSRAAAVVPVVGWFGTIAVLLNRTTEGDVLLPQTTMGYLVLLAGAGALVVGLYRLPPQNAGRRAEPTV
jgi:hypothetical protein